MKFVNVVGPYGCSNDYIVAYIPTFGRYYIIEYQIFDKKKKSTSQNFVFSD